MEGLADGHALRVEAGVVEGERRPARQVLGQFQDFLAEVVVGRLAESQHPDHAVSGDERQYNGLSAHRGGRGQRRTDSGGDGRGGPSQLPHGRTERGLVRGVGRASPDAGAGSRDRFGRIDLGEQGLEAVDALLVLVQHVGQVRVRRLVRDGVDRAPGGEGGHRHLGHQRERLVPVEGAGQQVGGFDEEGERAAPEAFELAETGRLDGQRDAVGRELQAQGLFVGVPARGFGGDAEGAGEPALDLERDGDDGAHAGAVEQRHGSGDDGQILVDGGHPGGAVPPRAGLHRDAGEALSGRGEAGGGPYLQLRLVVGGEQEEGGVAFEHVAGAFHGALEQAVEVFRGR